MKKSCGPKPDLSVLSKDLREPEPDLLAVRMEAFQLKTLGGDFPVKYDDDKLPRDPLPSWDGNTETFFAFWWLFSRRVLDNDSLSESSRMSRLCNAIPEQVKTIVVGLALK